LKQAKEEAQAEIEAYRQEREKQYKEHEARVYIFNFFFVNTQCMYDFSNTGSVTRTSFF